MISTTYEQIARSVQTMPRLGFPKPCAVWVGPVDQRTGRGFVWLGSQRRPARVVVWELHTGHPFVRGHVLVNLCGNERCIEPTHHALASQLANFKLPGRVGVSPAPCIHGEHRPCADCRRAALARHRAKYADGSKTERRWMRPDRRKEGE